ncbi:ribonuclease H-like domain-containing protein, partial [Tanacetum coccineum]
LRIEQYFQVQDYALWDVIENGNSFNPLARITTNADGTSTSTIPGTVTTEEKAQKKNDVKARSMLLMELPNEHQLTFNQYKDAKTLFAAIQTRFGGNDATKKIQKTLLKQITNEVDTANIQVSTVSKPVSTASTQDSTASLSDAIVYAFLANQPNGSHLVHEDLEQIHKDDLEEMDLKWQLALLSMRARRYYQKIGKKITINGSDTAGYDKSKVECFNCHKMGHFARECRGPRNQESMPRNQDSSKRTVNVEDTSSKAMVAFDGAGFDWSFMADEEVSTNIALMAFSDSEVHKDKTCSNTCLKSFKTLKTQYDNLRVEFNKSEFDLATYKRGLALVEEQLVFYKKTEIEKLKKEKESNQIKIDNFENASKSLDKLIGIQISNNNRKGYGLKVNKSVCENSSNEIKKTTDAPIIKDWVFDCDEDESEVMISDNGTGQREIRPLWNNALRTNHQNFSNSRRNFAPTAVLTKSSIVPISTARQRCSKAATPLSAARPINTAAPKLFVN